MNHGIKKESEMPKGIKTPERTFGECSIRISVFETSLVALKVRRSTHTGLCPALQLPFSFLVASAMSKKCTRMLYVK